MKYCPICKTCYDDNEDRCQKDRIFLVEAFPGSRIVDTKYRIDMLIGQGGMGAVYKATHLELDRLIALKIVLPDFVSSGETLERFRREARAAARLNHPNVITIYDFGILSNGRAYLAMELLAGRSLRDEIEKLGRLTAQRTLDILGPICEAVQAAHNAGVIHRDLKPDNIVLEQGDFEIELIKVVDFGIAKLKETAGRQSLSLTGPGLVMGTPHYMSPEQCKGEDLDARSDIYSLGVMLYEMLSGHVPFDAPTPSAVIIQHAIDPPRRLSLIRHDVTNELEAVVMKALAKSRQSRQQSVIEMLAELEAAVKLMPHMADTDDQPKAALGDRPGRTLSRFTTPREVLSVDSTASEEIVTDEAAPIDAAYKSKETPQSSRILSEISPPPDPASRSKIKTPPFTYSPAAILDRSSDAEPESKSDLLLSELDAEANELQDELSYTANIEIQEIKMRKTAELQGHEHVIKALAYAPDGRRLISAGSEGVIKIWDLAKKRALVALRGHEFSVNALALSPDGKLLVSVGSDGAARLWDLEKESELARLGDYQGSLRSVAFSPNGEYLALSNDADIELWDKNLRNRFALFQGHVRLVEALEFSRDGSLLISGGVDDTVRLWDVGSGESRGIINCAGHSVNALSNSADGILATAGKDGSIRLWDITSRMDLAVIEGHDDSVRAISFSTRGDYLVSADWGGCVKLWDTATGLELTGMEAHEGAVLAAVFSPDEQQIATAGYDRIIKLWDLEGLMDE